jgi:hypothetical protein
MGVLLHIAGQGPGHALHCCEEHGGAKQWLGRRGVCGSEEVVELAAGAVLLVFAPPQVVLVPEEVVPQEWVVQMLGKFVQGL